VLPIYKACFLEDLISFLPPRAKPAAKSKLIPPSIGTHGGGQHGGPPPPTGGGGATVGAPAANKSGMLIVNKATVVSIKPKSTFFFIYQKIIFTNVEINLN
jgi:hypothetical protein